MRIENRRLAKTADVSAARGTAFKELRTLLLFSVVLIVAVYLVVWASVDLVIRRISFETEAKVFRAFSSLDILERGHEEALERPRRILERLASDEMVPALPYSIAYIPSEVTNAFAFPGGTIGVTEGLLSALENDIELAFVIGHEIGHYHGRDHLRGLGREVGVSVVLAMVFGGEMGAHALARSAHRTLSLQYSRAQETAADEYGITLVNRVYGTTEGVGRLFELLRESEDVPAWAYMFATHPAPARRIEHLESYAATLPAVGPAAGMR